MPIQTTHNAYNDAQALRNESYAKPGSVTASEVAAVKKEVDEFMGSSNPATAQADSALNDMIAVAGTPSTDQGGRWENDLTRLFAAMSGNHDTNQGLGSVSGDFTQSILNAIGAKMGNGGTSPVPGLPRDIDNFIQANPNLSSDVLGQLKQLKADAQSGQSAKKLMTTAGEISHLLSLSASSSPSPNTTTTNVSNNPPTTSSQSVVSSGSIASALNGLTASSNADQLASSVSALAPTDSLGTNSSGLGSLGGPFNAPSSSGTTQPSLDYYMQSISQVLKNVDPHMENKSTRGDFANLIKAAAGGDYNAFNDAFLKFKGDMQHAQSTASQKKSDASESAAGNILSSLDHVQSSYDGGQKLGGGDGEPDASKDVSGWVQWANNHDAGLQNTPSTVSASDTGSSASQGSSAGQGSSASQTWLADPTQEPDGHGGKYWGALQSNLNLYPQKGGGWPVPTDVQQASKQGDCYLCSTLASLAEINPNLIKNNIKDDGNGTYSVTMYDPSGKQIAVGVDARFGSGYNIKGSDNQFNWATIMEKAFYKYDSIYHVSGNAGDTGVKAAGNGGYTGDVMKAFTGSGANLHSPMPTSSSDQVAMAQEMATALTQGQPVTAGTTGHHALTSSIMLVGDHAYSVTKCYQNAAGQWYVQVRNPWGTNPRDLTGISTRNDNGYCTMSLSQFCSYFSDAEVGQNPPSSDTGANSKNWAPGHGDTGDGDG